MESSAVLLRTYTFAVARPKLPYPSAPHIDILGVVFDMRFSFGGQVTSILDRAKIRVGTLSRLAGCKWGAETAIIRLTSDALAVSLLRY